MNRLKSQLYVPLRTPRDAVPFLAKGELHWRKGYSAHAPATTWFGNVGLPSNVQNMLDETATFGGAELIDGFFERKTDLRDGLRGPSQTDLLAIIRIRRGIAVLAVEEKVEESFGNIIGNQESYSEGKKIRPAGLQALLGVQDKDVSRLRYQLFPRAAAAVFEYQRYNCNNAFLLVYSFSAQQTGYDDFCAFARAVGLGDGPPMTTLGPKTIDGVSLYAGWLSDALPTVSDRPV